MLVDIATFSSSGFIPIFRIEISYAYVIILPHINSGKLQIYRGPNPECHIC